MFRIGSKYPNNEVLGTKCHSDYSICVLKPHNMSPWTFRETLDLNRATKSVNITYIGLFRPLG